MFSQLTNVTLYSAENEVVCRKATGFLIEQTTENSFYSRLQLSTSQLTKLKVGQNYYATGTRVKGGLACTELVKCVIPGHTPTFESNTPFYPTPKGFKPGAENPNDMCINFLNYSSTEFERNIWGYSLAPVGYPTSVPGDTLRAKDGEQTLSAAQRGAWFCEGPANIMLTWGNKAHSVFGVWIHFNYQMFGLGPRPIWFVYNDGDWSPSGNDPAVPYTFSQKLGYDIVATPTSGTDSLSVNIIIQDLQA